MARAYLSSIDAALLQLDDPTNLMMITAVMVFKAPISFERLKATIESRLLSMGRFRQRLAWSRLGTGKPYWEDDPDFDLSYHLQRARLDMPPPGNQAALQDAVSLLASSPLDLSRPLWQFHLIENYDECCALVLRFHHSIADGMALVHVILSLTDSDPDAPWPTAHLDGHGRRTISRWGTLLKPVRSRLAPMREAASKMVRGSVETLVHPSSLLEAGRTGGDAALDLVRFLLLKPDPDTALRGELGVNKRVAWSDGVPLEEIQAIRRALGGTVNDVLLSIVAGALRRYLQDQGEPVDSISLRATVPVNMRAPGREAELGNRVGAVFFTLPVSIADPVCRLGEIVRLMNGRKDSLESAVFYSALRVLGQTPARIANSLVNTFGTRATAVMTNVRGPQEQLYLAGSPVDALLAWVPTTGRIGVGVSVLSYAGEVRLGILTDEGLVPDPEQVIAAFHAEFDALLDRAGATMDEA
jgi:diacylglycerol O-acyltransferase